MAIWLREASHSDCQDKLVNRCHAAAGEIERLERELQSISNIAVVVKPIEVEQWWKKFLKK